MKKTYNIEIDCANCANSAENAINKLDGVVSATVNYMTQKLTVDFAPDADEGKVLKAVLKTARKTEPDFVLEV